MNQLLIPTERIERTILEIRRVKVIVDADLAIIYITTTKKLNQAVNRNKNRFPEDLMFQLTIEKNDKVITNCDHLSN